MRPNSRRSLPSPSKTFEVPFVVVVSRQLSTKSSYRQHSLRAENVRSSRSVLSDGGAGARPGPKERPSSGTAHVARRLWSACIWRRS